MQNETSNLDDDLRPEYDMTELLKGGVRGKYVERYRRGTNLVPLEPDVAEAFPSAEAVNEALRLVIQLAKLQQRQPTEP
jgi:hypothetical protein